MKKDASLAQTCIQMDDLPSIKQAGIKVVKVPIITATQDSFAAFGKLVYDYANEDVIIETWPTPNWRPIETGTGNEAGITEGKFEFSRLGGVMTGRNHAVDGNYITGWFNDPASANFADIEVDYQQVYVREANYHPDGGQVFYPLDGTPFVALLALPGDDISPADFIAFYCDGSFGVQIYPNIWHQPVFPIAQQATFMGKQGKVHACVACDLVSEFGCYLSVPLARPLQVQKDKM